MTTTTTTTTRPPADGIGAMQRREADVVPMSFDAAAGTIELCWTSGSRGTRYDWSRDTIYEEELEVTESACDMSRFKQGVVQLLDGHNVTGGVGAILGVCTDAWLRGGKGFAKVKLSQDPAKAGTVADIKAGVIRSVSVGYRVLKYTITATADRRDGGTVPLYVATSWEPHELSMVTVPFDAAASSRSAAGVQALAVSTATTRTTLPPAVEVRSAARPASLPAVPRRDPAQDARAMAVRGVTNAIEHRMDSSVHLDGHGQRYRSQTLLGMARELLPLCGIGVAGLSKTELAARALTTSDFPALLQGIANKRLRAAYQENPGTFRKWARQGPSLKDFRPVTVHQVSAMPDLLKIGEHGELSYGALTESAESYRLLTFGRLIGFSRQALLNDDLRAFTTVAEGFGAAAARLENRTAYAQLTSNPTMSDGIPLFDLLHSNTSSGPGSALSTGALGSARAAMRRQVGLQFEPINIVPRRLITPAALETAAYRVTSSAFRPATPADINPFAEGGRTPLEPIVESVLDNVSSTQWYLTSDRGDTVEFAYLEGATGPFIDSQAKFESDGVTWKCRLDFAAKAIDFRGLHRGNGS